MRSIAVIIVVFLGGCLFGGWSSDEVYRVSSPDNKLDAVLLETNGGATTSLGYEVHLVLPDKATRTKTLVASFYGAIRNEDAYGINMRWDSNSILHLEYLRAESTKIERTKVEINGRTIELTLLEGVNDPSAPPGGMLYNLQGRPHDQ